MTQHPEDRRRRRTGKQAPQARQARGEVLISGLDTGPAEGQRGNRTPTEDHARFLPPEEREPEDEDG
ncbi:hypothetical protein [Deinococcus budaensis]|uniref:Uncharacterized protein n=1 Tax=Deinococcus budaensis TaxID=1665626 RepID=A0A7W8LQC4_9DEIO|nr:hypothetical protein [Deinococcus budaensis]MBB5234589.1 hypothetical protein [Deinococcus budaensis]